MHFLIYSGKKWWQVGFCGGFPPQATAQRGAMFRGVSTLNLDSKGRLAVPSKHRDFLQSYCAGRLIVTADPGKCLLIYPQPDWEPIEKKLNSLSSFNPQSRSLQRLLVGNASDVELDGAGRILVPPPLRQFAGLEKASYWSVRATSSNSGTKSSGTSNWPKHWSSVTAACRRSWRASRCERCCAAHHRAAR